MVDTGREDAQEVVEQERLLLEVEVESLVVDLDVGDLDDDLLELIVLPRVGGSLHHREGSVVEFVVVDVEENELRPEVRLLRSPQDLGDVCR